MLDERPLAPLSPPTSPPMSGAAQKVLQYQWHQPTPQPSLVSAPTAQLEITPVSGQFEDHRQPSSNLFRPPLRSHKSFPYSLGPSSRLQHEVTQDSPEAPTLVEFQEKVTSLGPQPTGSSDLQPATFGGSAPTSPAGNLSFRSPRIAAGDAQIKNEDMELELDELGEGDERAPMTAAELRAHKRKMKRFRLTHNQTRFLMSEFARQPHPDAAHRERLSREIPGLSPRQVQVWFQNRRAKLKRLTTDDRERIMSSRALPADFDMAQALHSPFGATPQSTSTPMPSPGIYASFGGASGVRGLTLDTQKRVPECQPYGPQFSSPTSITPALGAFAFTPPQSATDIVSPASAFSNASSLSFHTQESPRRQPYGVPVSSQTQLDLQQPHVPRLHLHDRFSRHLGETAGSPLRSSMSYSGFDTENTAQSQIAQRSSSFSEHSPAYNRPQQQRSLTGPMAMGSGPYGLGFIYNRMTSQQSSEAQQQQQLQQEPPISNKQQISGLQQTRRASSHLAGPPIASYSPYQPRQFSTPQLHSYPNFASHFPSQSFQDPFGQSTQEQRHLQQTTHQQPSQHFAALASQTNQFVPLEKCAQTEAEDGDNSDGGVPIPPSYQ